MRHSNKPEKLSQIFKGMDFKKYKILDKEEMEEVLYTVSNLYIPAWIMNLNDLSLKEKILYSTILNLSQRYGYCFASRTKLSLYAGQISVDTVDRLCITLTGKGFIHIKSGRQKGAKNRVYPLRFQHGFIDFV